MKSVRALANPRWTCACGFLVGCSLVLAVRLHMGALDSWAWNKRMGVVPHVSMCNYCHKCTFGEFDELEGVSRLPSKRLLGHEKNVAALAGSTGPELSGVPIDKCGSAECAVCYGCHHKLVALDGKSHLFNTSFAVAQGTSKAQVYWVEDASEPQPRKKSVVKLWGLPIWDKKLNKYAHCKPDRGEEKLKALASVQSVAQECGLKDIITNTWTQTVNGILPGTGYHVQTEGLWSDAASGVSLKQLLEDQKANLDYAVVVDLLQTKLNKTEILLGSIFDLLLSQGDRHEGNLFFDESGHMTLIDNEPYAHNWRSSGVDSLFLPTTQRGKQGHLGDRYLRKVEGAKPLPFPDAYALLDYRCHVPQGVIGFDYPPAVHKCLQKFSQMTPDNLMKEYGMPKLKDAVILQTRAVDMLQRGFEWTLEFGEPRNPPPLRYGWGTPCCEIVPAPEGAKCADPNYKQDLWRPEGDSMYGRPSP